MGKCTNQQYMAQIWRIGAQNFHFCPAGAAEQLSGGVNKSGESGNSSFLAEKWEFPLCSHLDFFSEVCPEFHKKALPRVNLTQSLQLRCSVVPDASIGVMVQSIK